MSRGITLIELLTAMALSGIVLVGLVSVFGAAVSQQLTDGQKREEFEASIGFEQRVRNLIAHAYLNGDQNDTNSYFHGRNVSGNSLTSNGSDEIVFTTVGTGIPANATNSSEADFDARNQQFGPIGGPTEVAISMTAVGSGGGDGGVFLREQKPSDSDPDQGGYESVIDGDIESVSFEFFDGTDWVGEWDTGAQRTLPTAVRVSYARVDDPENVRTFVVRIPNQAPVQPVQEGAGGA